MIADNVCLLGDVLSEDGERVLSSGIFSVSLTAESAVQYGSPSPSSFYRRKHSSLVRLDLIKFQN